MKKRIIIFLILALILIGIGVYFTRQVNDNLSAHNNLPATSMTDKSRVAPPVYQTDEQISVVTVEGSAEKKSSTGGMWFPMKKGDLLKVDDSVRTGNESTLVLGLGVTSTIELSTSSEIEVRQLSGAVQRLGLVKGRASVDYGENGKRVLNIENADGTVVAKVDEGKFSILNNGQMVAVSTETGSVDLSAGGESVKVTKGMESIVEKGKKPLTPYAISTYAYLKLSAGACRKQSETTAVVRGTASLGTTVFVNDQQVKTGADGSFIMFVKVSEATNRVQLRTVDIWGKESERTINCLAPKQRAPIKTIDIDWGRKGG